MGEETAEEKLNQILVVVTISTSPNHLTPFIATRERTTSQ